MVDEVVGDEAVPRRGFEDELAKNLKREWRRGGSPAWAPAHLGRSRRGRRRRRVARGRQPGQRPGRSRRSRCPPRRWPRRCPSPTTTVQPTPTSSTVVETTTTTTARADHHHRPPDRRGRDDRLTTTSSHCRTATGTTLAQYLNEGGLELEARSDLRTAVRRRLRPGAVRRRRRRARRSVAPVVRTRRSATAGEPHDDRRTARC
jgi:hypothetical protein